MYAWSETYVQSVEGSEAYNDIRRDTFCFDMANESWEAKQNVQE